MPDTNETAVNRLRQFSIAYLVTSWIHSWHAQEVRRKAGSTARIRRWRVVVQRDGPISSRARAASACLWREWAIHLHWTRGRDGRKSPNHDRIARNPTRHRHKRRRRECQRRSCLASHQRHRPREARRVCHHRPHFQGPSQRQDTRRHRTAHGDIETVRGVLQSGAQLTRASPKARCRLGRAFRHWDSHGPQMDC